MSDVAPASCVLRLGLDGCASVCPLCHGQVACARKVGRRGEVWGWCMAPRAWPHRAWPPRARPPGKAPGLGSPDTAARARFPRVRPLSSAPARPPELGLLSLAPGIWSPGIWPPGIWSLGIGPRALAPGLGPRGLAPGTRRAFARLSHAPPLPRLRSPHPRPSAASVARETASFSAMCACKRS